LRGFWSFSIGSIGINFIEPFGPGLGPRLNAGYIGILTGAFAAAFAIFRFKPALLLLFLTFLLSLLSSALMSCCARVFCHQVFSLPALMAATSTAPVTTSASTAEASPSASTATFTWSLRTGLVHSDRTAFEIGSVKFCNRIGGFLLARHLDEPKALAASGIPIRDNRGGLDFAGLREQLLQTVFGDWKRKVPNVELVAHILLSRLPNQKHGSAKENMSATLWHSKAA
jgi:hypothetical protein